MSAIEPRRQLPLFSAALWSSSVLTLSGADPLVRGRRPRRPLVAAEQMDQGVGADGGLRPTAIYIADSRVRTAAPRGY